MHIFPRPNSLKIGGGEDLNTPVWNFYKDPNRVSGIFTTGNGLERLLRDCRLGRIHPANEMLVHELVGKFSLGIDLDDPQRWG